MKKIAIVQSSYIPWRGYFDLINSVDEFILFDDVQYTKRDWRSRNQIKTAQGLQWLSIPVQVKGKCTQLIKDVVISDPTWADKHWRAFELNYGRAAFFAEFAARIYQTYLEVKKFERLSDVNYHWLKKICEWLNISTQLTWSMNYEVQSQEKNDRLIQLCLAAKASIYLSGPSAKVYIDLSQFHQNGIEVEYMNYANYASYPQRFGDFESTVSILDLLLNVGGKNAMVYMKSFSLTET